MQSHFIKLDPPYQIIHYGGVVGIQIGTLIVVGEAYPNDNVGIDIYSHSHPVVSYVDKHQLKTKLGKERGNSTLAAYYGGGEGHVWSKVEVSDVDIIGMTDLSADEEPSSFEWNDFVTLVSDGFSLNDAQSKITREKGIFDLENYLRKTGLVLKLPTIPEHLEINVSLLYSKDDNGYIRKCIACQEENPELITFFAPICKNEDKTIDAIFRQLWQYLALLKSFGITIIFKESEIPELGESTIQKDDADIKFLSKVVKILNETYSERLRMRL